jgi:multidrug efflux pump subunit AcrA (membrane-fusion protein)
MFNKIEQPFTILQEAFMSKWFVRVFFLVTVGAGLWFGLKWYVSKDVKTNQKLGEVKRGDLLQRVTISGFIVPKRRLTVTPTYEGYIRQIYVKQGQNVKAGDPLVRISTSAASDDGAFPQRAQFPGRIVFVGKFEGEFVEKKSDSIIMRVDDLSQMFVVSDAPELDAVKLKMGQSVVIKPSALIDKTYNGRITDIAQSSNSQDRWERSKVEFNLRTLITDADERLRSGMSVTVHVIVGEARNVLLLSQEFVKPKGDKLYAILENGEEREIEVGLRNEEAFEIKSGLKEGDKVKQIDFLAL